MKRWTVEDLGRRSYASTLELQHERVAQRQRGEIDDRLLVVEHDDVVTLGRRRDAQKNVLVNELPVVEIERGGDATYHGPGQLVAYPIVLLEGDEERDLHKFLRHLEQGMIDACMELGLACDREPDYTGVWVGPREGMTPDRRKIASIGIAVRRWVTFHGLALNVSTDLSKFGVLNPCGLDAQVMTSLSRELRRDVSIDEVKPHLVRHLGRSLGRA